MATGHVLRSAPAESLRSKVRLVASQARATRSAGPTQRENREKGASFRVSQSSGSQGLRAPGPLRAAKPAEVHWEEKGARCARGRVRGAARSRLASGQRLEPSLASVA